MPDVSFGINFGLENANPLVGKLDLGDADDRVPGAELLRALMQGDVPREEKPIPAFPSDQTLTDREETSIGSEWG